MHLGHLYCLAVLSLVSALSGCSSVQSRVATKADLGKYNRIFVEHRLADGHGTDQIIARELTKMGYQASCGPLTMMPQDTDLIVNYEDRWTFDFTTYMIELDMGVKSAKTDLLLAEGTDHHPSLTGSSPVEMVDALLRKFFKNKAQNQSP